MKTGEFLIKIVSYIVCCAAVCAVFAAKQRKCEAELSYLTREQSERQTERLRVILTGLKASLRSCLDDKENKKAFADAGYYCRAASDLAAETDGAGSEGLRKMFLRIEKICDERYGGDGDMSLTEHQAFSEMYMRLSAMEAQITDGGMGAEELIGALSSGISAEKPAGAGAPKRNVSRNAAEKTAVKYLGDGVRIKYRETSDGRFIFASEGSFAVISPDGGTVMKSRSKTDGPRRVDEKKAAAEAAAYVTSKTGSPAEPEQDAVLFGIYYFTVRSGGEEYRIGIDSTTSDVIFELSPKQPS